MLRRILIMTSLAASMGTHAAVGFLQLPADGPRGTVYVFYPTRDSDGPAQVGPFRLRLAKAAHPDRGNDRLILISPGSGASPWVYFDLTTVLVNEGYVVAMPEHAGDNFKDHRAPGPASWKLRPVEVSTAIDRVTTDPRFAPLIDASKVGMYGMSAGGHTALTLAGGRWSPSYLKKHCEENIEQDFYACAGPTTHASTGLPGWLKRTAVKLVDGFKFSDTSWYAHKDPRIQAIVAGVPFAADFDLESLRAPSVRLGIVSASQDRWLAPQFHSEAVARACGPCIRIEDIKTGGHGALLAPLPPDREGLLAELIADPPGFDRAVEVPRINHKIAAFFNQSLLNSEQR